MFTTRAAWRETIGIPYYVVNHEERFERDVVRPFVEEYLSGRTPIPCSLCNNHLKFDQLLIVAQQIGAERVATGHYARVEFTTKRGPLAAQASCRSQQGSDLFPLRPNPGAAQPHIVSTGRMTKPEVRELARQHGLALAEKPDSQEICFVPGGDYKRFIDAYLAEQGESLPDTAGELVTTERRSHRRTPRHSQLHRRTAQGTRRSHRLAALRHPDQVETTSRSSSASRSISTPATCAPPHEFHLRDEDLPEPMRVTVKIRHRHEPAPAMIEKTGDDEILVTFDEPQRAITPGQAAVFYDGDIVVGGGWIG